MRWNLINLKTMSLETIIFTESPPNFLNLSLFICHLFAGGNFRQVQILYHPEAFDDQLYKTIESACPLQIPMIKTDISSPATYSIDQNQRTDHILQFIFFST